MDSRNAISNFLISDRGETRKILEEILTPYAQDRYLSDKDFVKIYRKAVNDLFDFAVQTDQKLNMKLKESLLSEDGTASEVLDFINEVKGNTNHPSGLHYNDIVQSLEVRMSEKGGKAYDQNKVIHSFRELKVALEGKTDLYDKIVMLSILQSGLSPSPISFTDLIPYEDISRIYNKTLPKLEEISNLEDFEKLNMFQRNNYNNDSIVPQKKLYRRLFKNLDGGKSLKYPSVDFLPAPIKKMITRGDIPQVITQQAVDGSPDIISATWNKNLGKNKIAKMRKEGDYSYVNKALMQMVRDENTGEPYVYIVKGKPYNIYKAINTLGDSFRAQEFYDNATKSLFANGYMKAEEVSDIVITSAFDADVLRRSKRPKYTKQAPVSPVQQTSGVTDLQNIEDLSGGVLNTQEDKKDWLNSDKYYYVFDLTKDKLNKKELTLDELASKFETYGIDSRNGLPKDAKLKEAVNLINFALKNPTGDIKDKFVKRLKETFKEYNLNSKILDDYLNNYNSVDIVFMDAMRSTNKKEKLQGMKVVFDNFYSEKSLIKEISEKVLKIPYEIKKTNLQKKKEEILNSPTSDPSEVDMSYGLTKEDFDEYSPGGANPIEQEITVVRDDFIVGNSRFPKSLATVEFLERRGYSPQLIKKIIDKIC